MDEQTKPIWDEVDPDGQWHGELVVQLLPGGRLPGRAYPDDAGLDLYTSADTVIPAGSFADVPCGIRIQLPDWAWGQVHGRSSTLRRRGLLVPSAVIDTGWRGEIFVGVFNLGDTAVVKAGERLGQLIVHENATRRVLVVAGEVDDHPRGLNGFGSSGS